MSDVMLLYLFTRLDALQTLLSGVAFVCGVAVIVAFVAGAFAGDTDCHRRGGESADDCEARCKANREKWWRGAKMAAVATAVAATLTAVVPSSRDMAVIVGGKVAVDAIRSPEAAEIGSAVKGAVLKKLRDAAK